MAGSFMVSPGVRVTEENLANVIPTLAVSPGATAGNFIWGPVLDPIIIDSENNLVNQFGKPTDASFNAFFTAANFLAYSGNILINRAQSKWMFNANNAVADVSGAGTISVTINTTTVTGASTPNFDSTMVGKYLIDSTGDIVGQISSVTSSTILELVSGAPKTLAADTYTIGVRTFIKNKSDYTDGGHDLTAFGNFIARYPSELGSSLGISIADSATWVKSGGGTISVTNGSATVTGAGATAFDTTIVIGSILLDSTGTVIGQVKSIETSTSLTLESVFSGTTGTGLSYSVQWEYSYLFDYAPSTTSYTANLNGQNDELHIVVIDENGLFSGQVGTVLEVYRGVSKASDAYNADGTTNYYKNIINETSKYVFWANHQSGTTNWGTSASGKSFDQLSMVSHVSLGYGSNGTGSTAAHLQEAYSLFVNDLLYDIALIPVGKASYTLANYVIQNVAEVRKDCVVFVSPENTTTAGPIIGTTSTQASLLKTYADFITSSSYGFIDSGYKYQYDRYNDVYRWIPLNGDIAGLAARTDATNDPWWSPAGFNRGQIKNVVKLAFNPAQTDRDTLYKARVNPVVSFPGQGVILYGDKTALSKPSAFDRINVRRLFIVLEKAISTASKYQLFEFNDSFTRGRFRAMVEPFLRDVQGRRGIQRYEIICDSSNNTQQIISTNQFVADIKILPAYSINYITLNFIATNNSASFTETGV